MLLKILKAFTTHNSYNRRGIHFLSLKIYSSRDIIPLSNLPFQQRFFFNWWKIARNIVFCLLCFFLYEHLARHLTNLQEDCKRAKLTIKENNLKVDLICLSFTWLESSSKTPISGCRLELPCLVSSAISSFMLNGTFSIFFWNIESTFSTRIFFI